MASRRTGDCTLFTLLLFVLSILYAYTAYFASDKVSIKEFYYYCLFLPVCSIVSTMKDNAYFVVGLII